MRRRTALLGRMQPRLVLLVDALEVGQGDARDLLVAGALQEALVAGLGVGAQVDEAVGHQPRQRRHDGVEPRVVDVDLHVAHPPRLVDGAHEDHAVGEDGALEEAEGLHAGAAVAAARVLLLHEPRDEHVVLEGVRVARGVRVEGVQDVEVGVAHLLPLVDGLGHDLDDVLQLDAVGDALEEGGLAHGDVALHAEGQVAPRPPAPALLRALARRLHRQQVVHDQPRVPAVHDAHVLAQELHHLLPLAVDVLVVEALLQVLHRGEALLMQQLLVARPDAGHLEQLLAGEAAALRGGHSKPPRSPPPRAPLLRLLWRAPARELPTARGAQRGAWLMRRVAAGARLEAKGPTVLLLLLVRGRGAAAPPSRRAGERRRRQPRRRRRG
mmetsp:Transcript_8617/g.31800  ORF Transcript_8617/g.31800 Transcript_8617/m.31800 type:complete len:383 (-) Transcript_8617:221-1369(-)